MISLIIPSLEGKQLNHMPDGNYEVIISQMKGVAQSRNEGASRAKGNILLFCDDDIDLYDNVNEMEESPYDWWVPIYVNGTLDGRTSLGNISMNLFKELGGPVIGVRKSLFNEIGGYHHITMEDTNFRMRLAKISSPACMNVIALIRRPFKRFNYLRRLYAH